MLDYPSLFALAAVVREGSFERAATVLHVTPSAVSQRIRLLEERLGCALVVRGQPCKATETGRRLCQHIDRVSLLEHELQADMPSFLQTEPTRVSVPLAVNADTVADVVLQAGDTSRQLEKFPSIAGTITILPCATATMSILPKLAHSTPSPNRVMMT